MDVTGSTRTVVTAATATTAVGLTVVLYGTIRSDVVRTMGGTCLTLTALATIALVLIRRWTVDTSEERRALGSKLRDAQSEHTRYIALQAALENEQGRLTRDRAAERLADAARLLEERKALREEFEEQRAALIVETMEATWLMFQRLKSSGPAPAPNKVIPFPKPQPQPRVERERSREHGVVGP